MPSVDKSPTVVGEDELNKNQFFVNDGLLMKSEISRLRPSSQDLPLDELRKRYQEDGYLFIRGLLPRSDVLKAREDYFKFLSPSGVLKPGTSAVDGIFDSAKDIAQFPGIGSGAAGGNGHPGEHAAKFVDLALRAHGEPWYSEKFCKHPILLEFIARFTGWDENTVSFRRTLLRNNIPGAKAIGVHYDQIFLRYGEPTSVTAWVPMGDIGLTGGGLIYLKDGTAHCRLKLQSSLRTNLPSGVQIGKQFEQEFTERAKATGLTAEESQSAFNQNMMSTGLLSESPAEFGRLYNRCWLLTDYEAGDVVLHSPYTVRLSQ